ncbi:transcription factor BTF3 [Musa troglodytarum]|uniref:Nascent polypeptide-associated complex subunit beta n=3 Tax=Magnoliopsida TaxID=3398 RepID=A0A9E7JXV9_9LILI|nr:transcription factor BTF3 [Musa troglodytarum]
MITRTFEYGGGFPQSFSNQDAVCLPGTVNSAMGMTSGRGMCSSGSSMAGMLLPANAGTLNNTSPVTPQSGDSSGNTILNHESALKNASTSAVNWSNDDVLVLRRGLEEYADKPSLTKYINIAGMLPQQDSKGYCIEVPLDDAYDRNAGKEDNKNDGDSRRCKAEDYNAGKKASKEKMVNSSSVSSMNYIQPDNVTHNAPTMLDVHHSNQVSCEAYPIESETQRCLVENVKLLNLIMANFEMNKVEDNVNLLHYVRKNIVTILNSFSGASSVMSRMPPLHVSIGEDLFRLLFFLVNLVIFIFLAKMFMRLVAVTKGKSEDEISLYWTNAIKMNREKLMKMAGAVRTGGKGSMRRKKKAVHKTPTTDDKRLQSTLKRIGVNTIPAIEEVNIFKDDIVIQFPNPKVQASIAANTWVVSGSPQTKKLQDLLPAIINQLGPDNLENLRKLAEQFQKQAPAASAATGEEDDDDVPELVPGETFEEAAEEKQAS